MVIGSCATGYQRVTLQGHTIYTSTGLKLMSAHPDFRQANRIFFYFWEACKLDYRSYGMCYLKNRRSGFSFMASSEVVNIATTTKGFKVWNSYLRQEADAKKMFTDKVVPISTNYPFFFKPIQDGMERPKTELSYKVPSRRLTRNTIKVAGTDGGYTIRIGYNDRLEEHRR